MMNMPAKSKRTGRQEIGQSTVMVAPVKGWNARDPQAQMQAGYALYLDNFFPSATSVDIRKGAIDHVTGLGVEPIKSLGTYNDRAGVNKLWAFTDNGAYDVTAAGVFGAISTVLTEGRVLTANIGTSGGSFMYAVNGVDDARYWNGLVWTTVANYAVSTGATPLLSNTISNLNVFKRQLYFLVRNTMEFYYLPIDSVTGTLGRFPLGALFNKGGSLIAMGTWTIDGGAGVDDLACFVTSEGQIAVYRGTDPSSASTWALVGVYNLAPPLGPKCFMKYGGDLIYISKAGAFPLSKALIYTSGNSAIALTDLINTVFSAAATAYGSHWGWQGILSLSNDFILFNIPVSEYTGSVQYVMNTKTGAWCRFTDWNAFCWEVMDNELYMGMVGKVAKAYNGLSDFDDNIYCFGKTSFSYLGGTRARLKKVNMIQPILNVSGRVSVSIAVDVDFAYGLEFGAAVYAAPNGYLWDTGIWDAALWTDPTQSKIDWVTVAVNPGMAAAIRLRVAAKNVTVGWSATNLLYESGGIRG